MPLPKEQHKYTVDDILALPDGQRAELIDGQIYDMGTSTKKNIQISDCWSSRVLGYRQNLAKSNSF